VATPLVSIGMPVFHAERHLAASVATLLAQDHRDFELVLVDNASGDGTEAICTGLAAQDRRIRYVQNRSNLGSRRSYNLAQELARGPYFVWARAHDRWAPPFLRRCLEVLEAEPATVLCHAKSQLVGADGEDLGAVAETIDTRGLGLLDRLRAVWTHAVGPAAHGLVRTNMCDQTRRYRDYPGCDLLFLQELAVLGAFAFVDEPLLTLRQVRVETSEEQTLARTRLQMNPHAGRWRRPFERHVLDFSRAQLEVIAALPIDAAERHQLAEQFVVHQRARFLGSFERTAAALLAYVVAAFGPEPRAGYEVLAVVDDIAFGLLFLPDNLDLLAAARHLELLQQPGAMAGTP